MLETIGTALLWFQGVVLLYFVVANGTYTLFTVLAMKDVVKFAAIATRHNLHSFMYGDYYKPLSIIVPAFNEEKTITENIASLLSLEYPEYEVIVVNDGSTDATLDRLKERFRLVRTERIVRLSLPTKKLKGVYVSLDHTNLIVLDKENGGKADALNAGINASSYPIFCSIDADSLLEGDALLRAARAFVEDKRIIATGGIVRVLNGSKVENGTVTEIRAPRKAIECFQAVEYVKGFLSGRTAWNRLGSLLIISGAFGIFRKDVVMSIKGYRDTVGEDMDLVVRLHRYCHERDLPYRIIFIPDPICYTQVPADYRSLLRQRNRWHRGLIDSLLHSRRMFLNPRYGTVGFFGYLYFGLLEGLGPVIEFLGYLSFIILFLMGHVNSDFALLFFVVAILWSMWINIASVLLDDVLYKRYRGIKDLLKLCLFGLLEMIGYRQLITMERMIATFMFWKKDWGKPKRHRIKNDEKLEPAG